MPKNTKGGKHKHLKVVHKKEWGEVASYKDFMNVKLSYGLEPNSLYIGKCMNTNSGNMHFFNIESSSKKYINVCVKHIGVRLKTKKPNQDSIVLVAIRQMNKAKKNGRILSDMIDTISIKEDVNGNLQDERLQTILENLSESDKQKLLKDITYFRGEDDMIDSGFKIEDIDEDDDNAFDFNNI